MTISEARLTSAKNYTWCFSTLSPILLYYTVQPPPQSPVATLQGTLGIISQVENLCVVSTDLDEIICSILYRADGVDGQQEMERN